MLTRGPRYPLSFSLVDLAPNPEQASHKFRVVSWRNTPRVEPPVPAIMSPTPFLTIGIPCLNEEAFIEHCISCVMKQDYPMDRMEVIVADGGSTDRTREILDELGQKYPNLRWIDNPARIQAPAMNEIIRQSTGEFLIRLDAHCQYQSDYVKTCVQVLARTGADNVGGAQRARSQSRFQRALCAALTSPVGVGGANYRDEQAEGFVDTVFCGAFRRSVFETVGMFDPNAITNEDAELNQRIIEAGGKVYLSRDLVAEYFPRDSFRTLAKQYFKYGQGRARTLLKHGHFLKVRPALPFLMVIGGATLLFTSPHKLSTWMLFSAYSALTGTEAIRVGRRERLSAIPLVWAIFPVLHISHGIGFARGLSKYLKKPDWAEAETVPPLGSAASVTSA